jgi:putative endonuclease
MTKGRRYTGQQGEAIARAYLQRKGYSIIAVNWRCRAGEIDVIATDGPVLVFIEVRTRRSSVRGSAEESITPTKQRRLAALAHTYLQSLEERSTPWPGAWRIDVLALQLSAAGDAYVQHFQHAVEASE